MNNNASKWPPVNLWVAIPLVMQIAFAGQLLWGFFGNAWEWSWLCSYIGVVLSMELLFYNDALKKGNHPIKALYPIVIMLGFAFFFTAGFAFQGWSWGWIGLVLASVGVGAVWCADKAIKK